MKNKYPELFKRCWEIAISDTWIPIIDRLCDDIQKRLTNTGIEFNVLQVKEKFAGLRFYKEMKFPQTWTVDKMKEFADSINDLIQQADAECSKTCEACGNPGRLFCKKSGWLIILCNDCAKKENCDNS